MQRRSLPPHYLKSTPKSYRAVQVVSQSSPEHIQKTLMRAIPIFTQYLTAVDNVCACRNDNAVVVHDGIYRTSFARY